MRGEGEAKAMEIFNAAHGKNPAFYQLLKTLETYRSILDEQTTIVLSADSPLLKLLSHGLPEPAEMPGRPSSTVEAGEEPVPTKVQAAPTVPAAQKQELPKSPSPQASAGPAATTQGAAP
jgi:membrane protease subunit HflC